MSEKTKTVFVDVVLVLLIIVGIYGIYLALTQ